MNCFSVNHFIFCQINLGKMSHFQDSASTTHVNFILEYIGKCTDYMVEYFKGKERETHLKPLKNIMEEFYEVETTHGATRTALNEVLTDIRAQKNHKKKKLDRNRKVNDEDEGNRAELYNIRELYNAKLSEKMLNITPTKKSRRYVEFERRLDSLVGHVESDDDGDLAITADEVNTVDMITKQTMVDPVRVKQCGHSFERSSILALLKRKPYIRCPMPGCMEMQIKPSDLEDNVELRRLLKQNSRS